jgi:ABC-type antimicrobial peptide transport system permease subunit
LQFPGADWATTKNSTWLFVLVYVTAIGTIVAASLIAAFGPAWRATTVDPAVALRAD